MISRTSPARARALAVVLGPVLALALLATLLVTSYVAPAAARDGSDTARSGSTGTTGQPDQTGKKRRTTQGLQRMVVVDHNIERRPEALNAALRRAFYADADWLTLQEVCWWQARDLRAAHPTWSVVYQSDNTSTRCTDVSGLSDLGNADRGDSGNVVIWTGGNDAGRNVHTFRSQAKPTYTHGMACLRRSARIVTDVCSVHLVHAGDDKGRQKVQVRQAKQVAEITSPWIRAKHLVVVGGDFNSGPMSRPMDFLFKARGHGRFMEATRCRRVQPLCRKTKGVTLDGGQQKIDYVFFSINRTSRLAPYWLDVTRTLSDHHMITGSAWVDLRKVRGGTGRGR